MENEKTIPFPMTYAADNAADWEYVQERRAALKAECAAQLAEGETVPPGSVEIPHNFKRDQAATRAGREAARERVRGNGKP